MRALPDLRAELVGLIRQIRPGQAASYGQLAAALGDRVAARWVGHAVRHEIAGANLPLHRITLADGTLGGHIAADARSVLALLAAEGVPLAGQRVDLPRAAARLAGAAPLARLRALQESFEPAIPERMKGRLRSVAGVDVSYRGNEAFAAYALFASPGDGEPEFSLVHRRSVSFPYISGYLTFRELPCLLALLDEVRHQDKLADVILVDGSGLLHPRRAGIATMFGAVADVPTIGVTKKLLVGRMDRKPTTPSEAQPILVAGKPAGHVLLPSSGTARPLYVSPGHHVGVTEAIAIVRRCLGERRLPTPIYWADRLSRRAAKECGS
ncbi:MAG: endonuclease V [Pirellulales bacterium]